MSNAARGTKCLLVYMKGNAEFIAGEVKMWMDEHEDVTKFVSTVIKAMVLEIIAKKTGIALAKKILKLI